MPHLRFSCTFTLQFPSQRIKQALQLLLDHGWFIEGCDFHLVRNGTFMVEPHANALAQLVTQWPKDPRRPKAPHTASAEGGESPIYANAEVNPSGRNPFGMGPTEHRRGSNPPGLTRHLDQFAISWTVCRGFPGPVHFLTSVRPRADLGEEL